MAAPTSDKAGIRQTIRVLRAAGWELDSVWDGEESIPVTKEGEAIAAIMALDSAHLYVSKDDHEGFVYFVLGNEPDEVINDYTVTLMPVLDPMTERWYAAD
jgi:antitoxin (DNA-binding transcriptional repressor) of toxin-antitoxin stability system